MELDFNKIQAEVAAGYINVQQHPQFPLRIFNYSQKAQYEWRWTPETRQCRGLILDDDGKIVARPFEKFFSYEQLKGEVPSEPFKVYEKADGSLGILFWWDNKPHIATRGSFVSDQAIRATRIFRERYAELPFDQTNTITYLFEIILPENRIVVDYGEMEDLVLLAAIDTASGFEFPLEDFNPAVFTLPIIRRYDGIQDFTQLQAMAEPNKEGFVVRFESGTRVKLKFEEYKRLHKLLTGVNERHIWGELKADRNLDDIIDRVPDEYFSWVKTVETRLKSEYAAIAVRARADFQSLFDSSLDRKALAHLFRQEANPHILFAMLDGKDYSEMVWKMIRPEGGHAFRRDIDS